MRHLFTGRALLGTDPATGLGRGTIVLQAPPGPSILVDRVQLSGPSPAKAIVRDAGGADIAGTRAANRDAVAGLGLVLLPGQQLTVDVFDGTVGATHTATAWG